MPAVITSFLGSKKALTAAAMIIAASVLCYAGKMTMEQWTSFVKWVSGAWLVAQGTEDAMTKSAAVKMGVHPDYQGATPPAAPEPNPPTPARDPAPPPAP